MKMPDRIELTEEDLKGFLKRVEARSFTEEDYKIIQGMVETIRFLQRVVQQKKASIGRLLRLLFGGTEKLKKLLRNKDAPGGIAPAAPAGAPPVEPKQDTRPKGHGRNGAKDYTGAKKREISHPTLKSGDCCPVCQRGKVYDTTEPGRIVIFTANPPLEATVYEVQKLRCNLCDALFTPDEAKKLQEKEKYDEKARAMIPLLRYRNGFPFYRLGKLQECLGIPLPPSTQWDLVEETADRIGAVYDELIHQAAQGEILHNDDTTMKILEIKKEENKPDAGKWCLPPVSFLSKKGYGLPCFLRAESTQVKTWMMFWEKDIRASPLLFRCVMPFH